MADASWFDKIHVGIEIFLSLIIPIFIWFMKQLWDKVARIADEKVRVVKTALDEHEKKDDLRFAKQERDTVDLMDKLDEGATIRERQHGENQKILGELQTDLKGWKTWYERWQASKM